MVIWRTRRRSRQLTEDMISVAVDVLNANQKPLEYTLDLATIVMDEICIIIETSKPIMQLASDIRNKVIVGIAEQFPRKINWHVELFVKQLHNRGQWDVSDKNKTET